MKTLFFLILLSAFKVFSGTHPLTGSSIVNQAENSLAFSQMGFYIHGLPVNWNYLKNLDNDTMKIELGVNNKTLLSFRLESVSDQTRLEPFVRQYLRDYNQYGFEMTSLQSNKKNITPSVIVDLNQKSKMNRSRQVFFLKNTKLIIATCADTEANYAKTLTLCNQVLGTFRWK